MTEHTLVNDVNTQRSEIVDLVQNFEPAKSEKALSFLEDLISRPLENFTDEQIGLTHAMIGHLKAFVTLSPQTLNNSSWGRNPNLGGYCPHVDPGTAEIFDRVRKTLEEMQNRMASAALHSFDGIRKQFLVSCNLDGDNKSIDLTGAAAPANHR